VSAITAAICVVVGQQLFPLTDAASFTLSWLHSVEKIQWEEDWMLKNKRLVIISARVQGSGAGMDPPEGAIFQDGSWRYVPQLLPQNELRLTHSSYTAGYSICRGNSCRLLSDIVPLDGYEGALVVKACAT
jgi:hypothetical protein